MITIITYFVDSNIFLCASEYTYTCIINPLRIFLGYDTVLLPVSHWSNIVKGVKIVEDSFLQMLPNEGNRPEGGLKSLIASRSSAKSSSLCFVDFPSHRFLSSLNSFNVTRDISVNFDNEKQTIVNNLFRIKHVDAVGGDKFVNRVYLESNSLEVGKSLQLTNNISCHRGLSTLIHYQEHRDEYIRSAVRTLLHTNFLEPQARLVALSYKAQSILWAIQLHESYPLTVSEFLRTT